MAQEAPHLGSVPHFEITRSMHPKTAEIVLYLRSLVAEYARGERDALPIQTELSQQHGVSKDTIASIQTRLRVRPIFLMSQQVDKDGIRDDVQVWIKFLEFIR